MQVAEAVLAAYDSGELQQAVQGAGEAYKGWVKALGKAQKRKGKRLFMPLRLALTGSTHVRTAFILSSRCTDSSCRLAACRTISTHGWCVGGVQGPEVGQVLALLALEEGDVAEEGALVRLPQRMEVLRSWLAESQA